MTGVGVVEPYRQVYRKQKITTTNFNSNEPVAAKPVQRSVTLDSWGMYATGKKEKKNQPRGERPVGCKAKTGSTTGDRWGQVQSSKKKRGQAVTAGGLGSQSGVDGMGPQGLSAGSRWSTTCNLNTVTRYVGPCLLYTSPSPRDQRGSRMQSSA